MRDLRKIIIADDHPLGKAALAAILEGTDVRLEFDTVENGDALFSALAAGPCDVVILGSHVDSPANHELLARLGKAHPQVAVVLVDGQATRSRVEQARKLGACGIVMGNASCVEIRDVLIAALERNTSFAVAGSPVRGDGRTQELERLSPAQKRVVGELSSGKGNREIAEKLCLSEATIKSHLYAIYKQLGVKNRTQAILKLQKA